MCFIISDNSKKKIAYSNLIVYKGCCSMTEELFSPYYQNWFEYEKYVKVPKIKLKIDKHSPETSIWRGTISHGDHVYSSYDRAKLSFRPYNIGAFIIPKGSIYYINTFDEVIVANQLIYIGPAKIQIKNGCFNDIFAKEITKFK